MPVYDGSYNLTQKKEFTAHKLDLHFQSPARCWKLIFTVGRREAKGTKENYFEFNYALNLTGDGLAALGETVDTVTGAKKN